MLQIIELRDNGQFFENGNELTNEEYIEKKSLLIQGVCYGNSQRIILTDKKYQYMKGFYQVDGHEPPVTRHAFFYIRKFHRVYFKILFFSHNATKLAETYK